MLASETDKHWRTGYISGAFDMFHVGHLNLIRRSKERCGRLIVGVLTDELVAGMKKKWAMTPLRERMDIVGALKYVDEVDVTTKPLLRKVLAWEKYKFDAMFSGDDHLYDGWASEELALKKLGADLVFFPYTKEVSTSLLQDITLPPKAYGADKARKIEGFNYVFPFDKVSKGERIVLYGTGNVGGQYARQLAALDFCEIVAFANSYAKQGDMFLGMRVFTPDELAENMEAFDRVVIASADYHAQIVSRLRVLGFSPAKIV